MLSNFTLLHDRCVECFGYKFYGTAWQPEFGDYAFGLARGESCRKAFEAIPDDTDVLVTHTPCVGYGDYCKGHLGCVDLLHRVLQVKPKYHLFGHIHEGYSVTTSESKLSLP
jgi:Icc-related predicted phosphoesterase